MIEHFNQILSQNGIFFFESFQSLTHFFWVLNTQSDIFLLEGTSATVGESALIAHFAGRVEARDAIRLLQVHETVQLWEGQTANFPEEFGDHVLRELRQHGVDGNEVDALRLSWGDEIHLLDPGLQELTELDALCLMKNCKYLCQKPFIVNNDYSIDVSYQSGRKTVLKSTRWTFLVFVLDQIEVGLSAAE